MSCAEVNVHTSQAAPEGARVYVDYRLRYSCMVAA